MNYYVLEFAYTRDDDYSYEYKYFDNAEDALDFANKVCHTTIGYEKMKHPEDITLLRIPSTDFLEYLNNQIDYDQPCMVAHWDDVDTYIKKPVL